MRKKVEWNEARIGDVKEYMYHFHSCRGWGTNKRLNLLISQKNRSNKRKLVMSDDSLVNIIVRRERF